ncbi:MAG TPA: response regulator transcription factor [Bacteroidota bacterium]|jgi:DNA-binding NarL/FixJ family response regulator
MIRVFIADDHALIREGLKKILKEESDMVVVGEASRAGEVVDILGETTVDIIVLDISMPDRSGLELLKDIKHLYPKIHVLMLSIHPEDRFAIRALKAGAAGYVTKESASDELVKAIRRVVLGGKYVSANLAEHLASELNVTSEKPPHQTLSDREYEVMCLLASGKTLKQIAENLTLSLSSVNTYRSRILHKMNMTSSAELMHYAINNRLVD